MYDIPLGFSSVAIKSGLKNNDYDLAIIKSDPPSIVSALYTKNNFKQSLRQLFSLGLTSEELINLVNQNAMNLDS